MKLRSINLMLVVLTLIIALGIANAQTKRRQSGKPSPVVSEREVMALANRIGAARADVTAAANDYKASLQKLLAFQQSDIDAAAKTVESRRELVAQNIISKRELEEAEKALTVARAKVKDTQRQLSEADDLIAEARVEQLDAMGHARKLLAEKKKRERTPTGRAYYVRFIVVGELIVYDYSGALTGLVVKHRDRVMHDSRRTY